LSILDPLEHLLGRLGLPTPLPTDPMPTLKSWLDEATTSKSAPNPNALALATCDAQGRPSARIVLCKGMDVASGSIVFYTNYTSPKARAIEEGAGRIAGVFLWDHEGRQARIEGQALRASAEESDAYFRTRPLLSRLGAWSSEQSQPLAKRSDLLRQLHTTMQRFGVGVHHLAAPSMAPEIPRPPHWGGFRVTLDLVELWVGGDGRLHDRARWTRQLTRAAGGWNPSPWSGTRLQP
jgi:pyridoxamine 5'-phosphate oxidase